MFSGGCPAENSIVWVTLNLGEFSQFSTLREMYQLNQDFNAVSYTHSHCPITTCFIIFLQQRFNSMLDLLMCLMNWISGYFRSFYACLVLQCLSVK